MVSSALNNRLTPIMLLVACTTGAGCQELAMFSAAGTTGPELSGGESMTFHLEKHHAHPKVTITLQRDGDGYVIQPSIGDYAPERVGADLRPSSGFVETFGLRVLWIPEAARVSNVRSAAGLTKEQGVLNGRRVVVTKQFQGMDIYHYKFEQKTGFLVNVFGPEVNATLMSSTIPGL